MADVLTCTNWDSVSSQCSQFELVQDVYLLPIGVEGYIDLILNGGFSEEAFSLAFVGTLLVWATGLGLGLIISQVRKARI